AMVTSQSSVEQAKKNRVFARDLTCRPLRRRIPIGTISGIRRTQPCPGGISMVPLDGPHKKKTEGARTKATPLATAVSAKRTTRSKPARPSEPGVIDDSPLPVKTGPPASARLAASEDAIRLNAYFKWEAAGCPEGDDLSFWLAAEREL